MNDDMTQKSQAEQNAAQRQRDLLAAALERARTSGGSFLNSEGKAAPRLYPGGAAVSAFNALTLALHSDQAGYRTNFYMPFSASKKRSESVQGGEKGVPFIWYRWNEYQSRSDKDRRIPKEEYNRLGEEQKKDYAPVRDRAVRVLFNIEQTTLPLSDKESFDKALKEGGRTADRGFTQRDDKTMRMEFNRFLQNVAANLVPIRKDGTGIAHYDSSRDIVHLPAQKNYPGYAEYAQEAVRQIVTATGHPQRIGRGGVETEGGRIPTESQKSRERLVVELASAVKMTRLGLPARLSEESLGMVDGWKKSIQDNPRFIDALEADVDSAVRMIEKAERGQKIELRPVPAETQQQSEKISSTISMIQDDDGRWAFYIKPENEKGFSVYPDKADVGRFFGMVKKGGGQLDERFRQEMAQKYYTLAARNPDLKVDLFSTKEKDLDLSVIQRVSIVRTKGEAGPDGKEQNKILCFPQFKGIEGVEAREVSPAQWVRLWLAEDKAEYKKNLAATLFADILREKQRMQADRQEEQKRMESPDQKAKEQREEKAREALTREETGAVAGIVAAGVMKDAEEEQSRGVHR